MTNSQLQQYRDKRDQIESDIHMSIQKIKLYRESQRGFLALTIPETLSHNIEISQAVIIRLTTRLDRLKFQFDVR
jgi:uncharacterized coiled-coil DUF342 family protein